MKCTTTTAFKVFWLAGFTTDTDVFETLRKASREGKILKKKE